MGVCDRGGRLEGEAMVNLLLGTHYFMGSKTRRRRGVEGD